MGGEGGGVFTRSTKENGGQKAIADSGGAETLKGGKSDRFNTSENNGR